MERKIEIDYEAIAKALMREIMYDNGCVNRYEEEKYPEESVKAIASELPKFFENLIKELASDNGYVMLYKIEGYRDIQFELDKYFDRL